MATTKVIITVPQRPQYGNAYYALQRRFASGTHVIEVDEKQFRELQDELAVGVIGVTTEEDYLAAESARTEAAKTEVPPPPPPEEPKGPGKPMKRG